MFWTWYPIGHPTIHAFKNLPKDRPFLLMKFQNGAPANVKFLSATFTYTARAMQDPDLKKHEVCRGSIWSIHPQSCSMVADDVTVSAAVYIDSANGDIGLPFEAHLPFPGDYQLDRVDLQDGHNGLASVSEEAAKKIENKDKFLVKSFYITHVDKASLDTVALARHENPQWNLVIHTPPHYEIHAQEVRVLPYFPNSQARHADMDKGFRWSASGSDLPIGYVNQAGGVADASTAEDVMHEVRNSCGARGSDAATQRFQRVPQFKQTVHLEYFDEDKSGKRCRNVLASSGNRLVTNSLGDQLFVQETISHTKGDEYTEALWIKEKLAYAIFHDARKDDGEHQPGMLFIDDAFATLYPEAAAEFPVDRLAKLKLRAESALAIALP